VEVGMPSYFFLKILAVGKQKTQELVQRLWLLKMCERISGAQVNQEEGTIEVLSLQLHFQVRLPADISGERKSSQ
jgi:hypothetical protein